MVNKKLASIKVNKSKGLDNIHPWLLKHTIDILAAPLAVIFKKKIAATQLPVDWKKAYIAPLFKKRKRNSAANYKPISITSSVVKAIERIATDAIIKHLEKNSMLHHSQHGFQSGRSVDTNLLQSHNPVTDLIDTGIPIDVALFDLAKAFDRVCHRRHIVKLHAADINNQVVGWIKALLAERTQQVRIFTSHGMLIYSNSLLVKSGVLQGTILGPTLFNTFINDAPSVVHNYLTLYADDSKLIGGIRNQFDADIFQCNIALSLILQGTHKEETLRLLQAAI